MIRYGNIAYFAQSPFKDTGNIVEYFSTSSDNFYLYLYPPSYKNKPTLLEHYSKGKLIKREEIWNYKGNNKMVIHLFYFYYYLHFLIKYRIQNASIIFYYPIFLPFNSVINYFFKNRYIFWIWDYFPHDRGLMKIYKKLVKYYNDRLKYVIYLSPTIKKIYWPKDNQKNKFRKTILFGIKNIKIERKPVENRIGYVGNLRSGQGLEFLIDLASKNNDLRIQFVGEGPLRDYLEKYAKENKVNERIDFFGFIDNEKIKAITRKWEVAVAPYVLGKENIASYTDPGKIKLYIEYEIPVIMTKVSYIYKQLILFHAGVGIDLENNSFVKSLKIIQRDYDNYSKGIFKLKKNYEFNKYYDSKFNFLRKK